MIVFTSILPEDIKISKRTQDGVIGLKRFIEFANKGLSYFENESKEKYGYADEIIKYKEESLKENPLINGAAGLDNFSSIKDWL